MPIKGNLTTLNGIIPLMETLKEEECIIYQVVSQKAFNPWGNHLQGGSMMGDKPIFSGSPEFGKGLEQKIQFPFCFVTVKAVIYAHSLQRRQYLEKALIQGISSYTSTPHNHLKPLPYTREYDTSLHIKDIEQKKTRRNGMLLNTAELASLFHVPPVHLRNGKLQSR